jgi:hypothetical protein
MSHMRELESRLREDTTDIETQIPFWEFLDIEFDAQEKHFYLAAHYTQTPTFPKLFKNLIGSPPIKRIDDEITHPGQFRIQKQDWRPRSMYEMELGAENVIYTLIDEKAKLVYVGEAANLIRRLKAGHSDIKDWDFYRYDQLPPMYSEMDFVEIFPLFSRTLANTRINIRSIATRCCFGMLVVAGREGTRALAVGDDADGTHEQALAGAGAGNRGRVEQQPRRQPQARPTHCRQQAADERAFVVANRLAVVDDPQATAVLQLGILEWKRCERLPQIEQGGGGLLARRLLRYDAPTIKVKNGTLDVWLHAECHGSG